MSGLNKPVFDRQQFFDEIYQLVKAIPAGRVLTYGLLARLAGYPQYSRLAGKAVSQAPASFCLPCHRVVNSQGRPAPHWPEQQTLLEKEGLLFKKNGCLDLKIYLWDLFKENQ